MQRYTLLLVLLLSLGLPGPAAAQRGGGYHLHRATGAASGGGVAHGAPYILYGTLGQMSVATSAGATQTLTGGIWRGSSAPDLLKVEVAVNDTVPPVRPGDELTLAVAVTNNGVRPQAQVQVTTTVPAGLTLVASSVTAEQGMVHVQDNLTLTWALDTLSYEALAVLTYRVRVDAGTEGRQMPTTATARSASSGPVTHTVIIPVFRPVGVYMPLVRHAYPPPSAPTPPLHLLDEAPPQCPGWPVAVGARYRDDLDGPNDNDWFAFTAQAGATYVLATSDLGTQADTWLTLHRADDCTTPLADNDDIAWPANLASRIVWTAPADGVYCGLVRAWDWQVYGPETGYTFGVALTEMPAQRFQQQLPTDPSKAPPPPTPQP
ncbi:pre-peptidase C-terminal domain-containing protein [Desulfobaculum sp.]